MYNLYSIFMLIQLNKHVYLMIMTFIKLNKLYIIQYTCLFSCILSCILINIYAYSAE